MRVSPAKFSFLVLAIGLVLVSATMSLANNTDSVAFQGRLTDASDNAVADGPKDLTLSLWTDSVGGTMVFSEVRTVTTSKGLYSTCLGCGSSAFVDAMQSGDLWLQTQLAGQAPMVPRTRIRNVPRAIVASGVYGEATSGAAKARGIITTKPNVTGPKASAVLDADSDGDGHPEYVVMDSVTTGSASRRIWGDADEDGDPDGEISQSMTPTTSSVAIKWKGTGADANRTSSVSVGTTVDSATIITSKDDDGDGQADASVSQTSSSSGAQLTMKTGDNSMPNRISMNVTVAKQTQSTTFGERCDTDGDGTPESQYDQICAPDSVTQAMTVGHGGGGGGGGGQAVSNMRVRVNDLESRLTNLGLLARTSSSQTVTDSSVLIQSSVDLGGNGTSDVDASVSATSTRSELKGHFQNGDVPTQSQFSTVLDAVGSQTTWSNGDGGSTNIGASVEATLPRSVLKQFFERGDKPTQGQFSNLLDATMARSELKGHFQNGSIPTEQQFSTQLDSTGTHSDWSSIADGVTSSVAIVAASGADPITHSSGAKLTAGGVWTNASDENLKENFKSVNGGDLLDKIDELPIRQWNYKNEPDSVVHIGPTAQDFKSVFGVGENEKTISTIDPSGIALAGIKELHKENNELRAQNAELKKQLDELKKRIDQLVSRN
ncbi:MAG: tail fiber domain-containing protein [Candidatus Zixiibacteriota bacterium]